MQKMQSYNPKISAWVAYNKYADGKCIITNVKQRDPKVPFKGIPRRR